MRFLFSVIGLVCVTVPLVAASITIPDGSVYHASAPFSDIFSQDNTTRYQEVFGQSAFGGLSADGISITGLGFYSQMPLTNHRFSLSFHLSTTSRSPDGLSNTFADNVGADDTEVFNSSLAPVFLTTVSDGQGRNVFEFSLQQPFIYRPQSGNLLFDIRNFSAFDGGSFAHVSAPGDPVSRVYVPGSFLSGAPGTDGLQVRFTYEPVPEPSTITLFLLGAAALCVLGLKRRRNH
jgi:hypothetical protein